MNKSISDKIDFLGCSLPPDPRLTAQGWERRYIADKRMAKEALDTYGELGYEVRLEPISTDGLKDECEGCLALLRHFKMVYTRRK